VHIVVTTGHPGIGERPVEIQVRTLAQNVWAQIVEVLDEEFGWDLKHGDGPEEWRTYLVELAGYFREGEAGRAATAPKLPGLESA
jgi:ppGpp synthetase/RelA/SpoT-type nucleotidyltranferase